MSSLIASSLLAAAAISSSAGGEPSFAWLFFYLFIALGVSSLCSVAEAVFLSVTPAYARSIAEKSPSGGRLAELRAHPDQALSAILTLNTIAHTVGAAGVGLQASLIWGEKWLGLASAVMTVLILVVSEIIPKTVGATYWKKLSIPMANVIRGMIVLLKPVLFVLEFLTDRLKPKNAEVMSREELTAFGQMIRESATLRPEQAAIVGNAIALDQVLIKSILTPRTVVFTLPADGTVGEYRQQVIDSNYSRIPLVDPETGEWDRFVIKVDVLACEDRDKTLGELSRKLPLSFATQSVTRLLRRTVREQLHILQVVNEFGDAIGIITLEDLLETVIGQEILDEHDRHSDLQAVAIEQTRKRMEDLEEEGGS